VTNATVTLPALITVPGVDILATGQWDLSTGQATFTPEDLANGVDAAQCPAIGAPVIKLGHTDPRFDGEPAVGRIINMALAAGSNKVTGDLAGMPGWLGAVMESAYPNRSIEACRDVRCQIGHLHPFVITGLALLGVTPPGVGVLGTVKDVAALYGVNASAQEGTRVNDLTMAAGVTTEDVRRQYYADPATGYSMWITEMQLDPPQLIVCDEATDKVYRVPVTIKNSTITFGDAVEVEVTYQDIAAARGTGTALVFASAADSRAGIVIAGAIGSHSTGTSTASWSGPTAKKNLGTSASTATLRKAFAWVDSSTDGRSKSDYSFIHHFVSADGTVGDASTVACSSGIGILNGGRGGTSIPDGDKQGVYDHLAAHLRAAGLEPPDLNASASAAASADPGDEEPAEAAAGHGPMTGEHSHAHPAYASQGGDQTHTHMHSHAGDANHSHDHAAAASGTTITWEGDSKVDFTDEQMDQLRASLGLGEGADLNPALVVEAAGKLKERADAKVAASTRQMPPGVIAVDQERWDTLQQQVTAAEDFRRRQEVKERDSVISAAVRDGKFSRARIDHWVRLWDADPDGTRQVLAGLQRNVVPVSNIGIPGGDPDDVDDEYRALFGSPAE
jgi:hypothetical protein